MTSKDIPSNVSPIEEMNRKHGCVAVKFQKDWVNWTNGLWPSTGSFNAQDLTCVRSMGMEYIKRYSKDAREMCDVALSLWELEIQIRNEKIKVEKLEQDLSLWEHEIQIRNEKIKVEKLEQDLRKEQAEKHKLQTLIDKLTAVPEPENKAQEVKLF